MCEQQTHIAHAHVACELKVFVNKELKHVQSKYTFVAFVALSNGFKQKFVGF